jgi:hypothetical protein
MTDTANAAPMREDVTQAWFVNPETTTTIMTPHGRISINWSAQAAGQQIDYTLAEETASLICDAVNARLAHTARPDAGDDSCAPTIVASGQSNIPDSLVDVVERNRYDAGDHDVERETYRQMHATAVDLGYPSILEALEDLAAMREGVAPISAPANGEPDPAWAAIKRAIDQFVGRVPSIGKHRALNNSHLAELVERLDAAGDKEAADTIVWQCWWRALDRERERFLLTDADEKLAAAASLLGAA